MTQVGKTQRMLEEVAEAHDHAVVFGHTSRYARQLMRRFLEMVENEVEKVVVAKGYVECSEGRVVRFWSLPAQPSRLRGLAFQAFIDHAVFEFRPPQPPVWRALQEANDRYERTKLHFYEGVQLKGDYGGKTLRF